MNIHKTIQIIIGILVFLIITATLILMLAQVGERIERDCEAQGWEGNIEYFDNEINCRELWQTQMAESNNKVYK